MSRPIEHVPAQATLAACGACSAPLADDQRYCLQCGEPRDGVRRELPAALRASATAGVEPARRASPATLLAGVACLLAAMGVGVLIGRGGTTTAQPPITVAAAGPAATTSAVFTGDWPSGKDGWTVALRQLPKASTDPAAVARAEQDVTAKGAGEVGALDSDAFPTLTAGSYVVYSGVFDDEAAAVKARGELVEAFPDASVLHVASSTSAERTQTSTGEAERSSPSKPKSSGSSSPAAKSSEEAGGGDTTEAFEESKKAPTTVGTGGEPPATDDKPAAGGGAFEEIG